MYFLFRFISHLNLSLSKLRFFTSLVSFLGITEKLNRLICRIYGGVSINLNTVCQYRNDNNKTNRQYCPTLSVFEAISLGTVVD